MDEARDRAEAAVKGRIDELRKSGEEKRLQVSSMLDF